MLNPRTNNKNKPFEKFRLLSELCSLGKTSLEKIWESRVVGHRRLCKNVPAAALQNEA